MKPPVLMAIGAFLLVFGFLFALLSNQLIGLFNNYVNYPNYQITIAYSELVGLFFAATGAGLLAYGQGMNSKGHAESLGQ